MLLSFAKVTRKPAAEPPPTRSAIPSRTCRLGVALGAGAARGWTHIGVLTELAANGFEPDVVVGTSIGAAVGGAFAAGKLAEMEAFARGLTRRSVFGFMDLSFNGSGLIGGNRLKRKLFSHFAELNIDELPIKFGAVATEIGTGHEVWLTKGPLSDAIRASYALPGIFEPVKLGGRWLVDGAAVNPVPVTLCRALGADVVIAVNLSEPLARGTIIHDGGQSPGVPVPAPAEPPAVSGGGLRDLLRTFGIRSSQIPRELGSVRNGAPGIGSVLVDAFNIVQDRITRSRLAGDPPDISVVPKYGKVAPFDFHRADELIDIGREAVRRVLPELAELSPVRASK